MVEVRLTARPSILRRESCVGLVISVLHIVVLLGVHALHLDQAIHILLVHLLVTNGMVNLLTTLYIHYTISDNSGQWSATSKVLMFILLILLL